MTPMAGEHAFPFAVWTHHIRQSLLREIHPLLTEPGILSFALGLPAPELFPIRDCALAGRQVLRSEPDALQYSLPLQRLRTHVVELMHRRGVRCTEAEVFLTAGAQQAMSLLGQLLVSPGGTVVTEELTYDGMLNSLRPLRPRVLTVPSHRGTGLDLDALEALLARGERPSLVYTIPEGHNPLGTSMPARNRERLAALAQRYGVPVIEDDAYGLLRYDGDAPPAVRACDPRWVLYVGSFSKIMAPGLRVGWVVAPEDVVQRLSILKQGGDLDVSNYSQRILASYLGRAPLDEHLARLRREYAARRDAMLEALAEHFPATARWTRPASGLFVWVELPEERDTFALLERAVKEAKVAFIPGRAFCAADGRHGAQGMRLNFSHVPVERIRDGIRRLGQVLKPRPAVFPVHAARIPVLDEVGAD